MKITLLPAANQRAEHVVSVDGYRFNVTTGDRHVEATAEHRAYAEQAAQLSAANQDAAWSGNLSNDFLRKFFVNAPRVCRISEHSPPD